MLKSSELLLHRLLFDAVVQLPIPIMIISTFSELTESKVATLAWEVTAQCRDKSLAPRWSDAIPKVWTMGAPLSAFAGGINWNIYHYPVVTFVPLPLGLWIFLFGFESKFCPPYVEAQLRDGRPGGEIKINCNY